MSKALDKVWLEGLKYKIAYLQLPITTTKFLSNFLTDREAKIKVGNYIGTPFHYVQESPRVACYPALYSLYSLYTNDIPTPAIDCTYIQYVDDIIQIVSYAGKSRVFMADRTKKE